MSKASKGMVARAEYYCEEVIGNGSVEPMKNTSGSLFSNSIGAGLSDFKKERLKTLLQQGTIVLSPEFDEMLDPILALSRLQSQVRKRNHPSSPTNAAYSGDAGQVLHKKLKTAEIPKERTCMEEPKTAETPKERTEVDDAVLFFLENDSLEFEEMVKKHSDELSATLGHMEKQLEELLDTVRSTYRPMTLIEKQQLRKLIQKLPPKNLDWVVQIIQHGKMAKAQSCDEIFVDLEKEDNKTLWRLYSYVKSVERATALPL
ncbi:hypothetical protein CIPAW_04G030700 [Carya illinoinensis]|uniref:NET domain-containing protein n=1 Tax=Carya illinoinensis TaxID=32201 RepID=A0A8T1QR26_CARIL|nr:hypothetical protein CIPAW_04G030700 [Carya illinoinensis]KAG6656565.1 hypothetical protein CIPAW_04G030700 [Carya illinoinensis]KAG6656570.1 hypothetical protein CIPAW_04G030700 [Carya illinoinensis]KAG6716099.1 hypothetical protein I3842_04G030800 [Carya illinoinensis]KAG6716100.1 hypothetical protein I3842_04G030800 [Carya illinoinensis]